MKTTTGSTTKRINNPYFNHNSQQYICDCGHIETNVREHDRHILREHRYDPYLIERLVGCENWEHWRELLGRYNS